MRPLGTPEQLAKRRQKALDLLKSGEAIHEIARQLGTTERSVRRWREEAKHPKKKSKRGPGKQGYLSKQQIQKLERELLKGAYAHGYAEDYWTLDRIGHVIWELFQVRYVPSGVWRLLTRMGWSNQRVQRLAIQRNEEAIANWKVHQLSRIKKTT
jgi:transposase